MSKSKNKYPELEEIREDLDSLKDNVVALTKHVRRDGVGQVEEMSDVALAKISKAQGALQKQGKKQIERLDKQVKSKPLESIAVAFAGGLLASLLLNNRR